MSINSVFYIDTQNFSTATSVYEDVHLTDLAPDGFYSYNGVYRQQVSGILYDQYACPSCTPATTTSTTSTTTTIAPDCVLTGTAIEQTEPVTTTTVSQVACLADTTIIVQYSNDSENGTNPCPGQGHTCDNATFNLNANGLLVGVAYLSNTQGTNDILNYPPGVTSGYSRYNEFNLTTQQALDIVAAGNNSYIEFSLTCALTSCHTGVAWVTILVNNVQIYNGCPVNNFLKINPCTGVVIP